MGPHLDTCLSARLHHDDSEKASPCSKGNAGKVRCTTGWPEANGFQQRNHFKRRRVWRIGRTTRLPTRRPAGWRNSEAVPHRLFWASSPALVFGWWLFPDFLFSKQAQPVQFSHETHLKDASMECSTCHYLRANGTFSGLPSTRDCAVCHSQLLGTSKAERTFYDEYVKTGKEVAWKNYQKQPEQRLLQPCRSLARDLQQLSRFLGTGTLFRLSPRRDQGQESARLPREQDYGLQPEHHEDVAV